MKIAPLPHNEKARIAALKNYDILDTEPDEALDAMVELAAYICEVPISAISLVDENRQWFKAITGLDAKETSRDVAFCAHAILQTTPLVVPDATKDERFYDNPLVTSQPDIRFYAGVSLSTPDGDNIGTLCVIDREPRQLSQKQLDALGVLSKNIMAHLNLRLSHKRARQDVSDLQLAASIFESASDAMLVTDAENRIITINPAFTTTTGYTLAEVVGKDPKMLSSDRQDAAFYQLMWESLNASGHWHGELWNKRKNGEEYIEWLSINVIFNEDGEKRMHVAIFSDITEKKMAQEIIWKQANYDYLTQLPNRSLFHDRLEQELKLAQRSQKSVAVLFIDLDRFKEVNDTLGHAAGDMLLVEAAERISQCVRETDTVARMSGDEFTVILSQLTDAEDANSVAHNIIQKLSQPFLINDIPVNMTASIGVASYPAAGSDIVSILNHADKAMYAAKAAGRGQYQIYSA